MATWITIGNRFINLDACLVIDPNVSGFRVTLPDGSTVTARRDDEIAQVDEYLTEHQMVRREPLTADTVVDEPEPPTEPKKRAAKKVTHE